MGIVQDINSLLDEFYDNLNQICGYDVCISVIIILAVVGVLAILHKKRKNKKPER